MQLERTENGFQIDAVALGPLLGVPAQDVQRLMREGRITSLCEEGQDEDSGRHRITFRHGASRVRMTVNDEGEVLLRTRTTVAPHPGATPQAGSARPDEAQGQGAVAVDVGELTERLVTRFHVRHRRRLHMLVTLAEMVEDLHEDDEGVPAGLHRILCRTADVLESHMQTAERVVFPAIRRDATAEIDGRFDAFCCDHDRLQADCALIRDVSWNFQLPDGACTSWETLYAGLDEFITDLAEHMRLEKDVLFNDWMDRECFAAHPHDAHELKGIL